MKAWLKFSLRVLGLLFFFAAMTWGFLWASRSESFLDLVERERAENPNANVERLDDMEQGYSANRYIGYGVMAIGGILLFWSCLVIVSRKSKTRKAGIVVVSLTGVLLCYMTVMGTYTHFKIKRVRNECHGEISRKARLTVARIYYESGDWPRPYTNIVNEIEMALSLGKGDDPWGRGVLAECYMLGRGCDVDLAKSREHAESAARLGDKRGEEILRRLELGEEGPMPAPDDAILDVTGVDVSAIQMNPKRDIVAEKPLGFFRKGTARADANGKINRISFFANFGKGCAMTNGVARLDAMFPELCRRLDCELYGSGADERGLHWWVFRLVQTADWIVQFRMYNPKGQTGPDAPLFVCFDIAGLEADGTYSGSNCRFVRKKWDKSLPMLPKAQMQ